MQLWAMPGVILPCAAQRVVMLPAAFRGAQARGWELSSVVLTSEPVKSSEHPLFTSVLLAPGTNK